MEIFILPIAILGKFVLSLDLRIQFISDLLLDLGIYLIWKKKINSNLKMALYISLLEIPISYYSIVQKKVFLVYIILQVILCFLLFRGFYEISESKYIKGLSNAVLTLSILQVIVTYVIGMVWYLPPQITSSVTWGSTFVGTVITVLVSIITAKIKKI